MQQRSVATSTASEGSAFLRKPIQSESDTAIDGVGMRWLEKMPAQARLQGWLGVKAGCVCLSGRAKQPDGTSEPCEKCSCIMGICKCAKLRQFLQRYTPREFECRKPAAEPWLDLAAFRQHQQYVRSWKYLSTSRYSFRFSL